MLRLFQQFSFPGRHRQPLHAGNAGLDPRGRRTRLLALACLRRRFDNPDLIVAVVVGDGEAETGPLATSWHSNKFLNPVRDGAVLPILHLNGYKIANPTILARIPHEELEHLFRGYGYEPYFVEGSDPDTDASGDGRDAGTLRRARSARSSRQRGRATASRTRPRWPMIVLRTPKGWTGPKEVDGHKVEGFWRAHQVPLAAIRENPAHLQAAGSTGCAAISRRSCSTKRDACVPSCRRWRPKARAA